MTKTLTPKELANEFGTDARTIRKFLRSSEGTDSKVGKGQRWAIEARQVRSLRSRFIKWEAARTTAAEMKAAAEADAEVADA